MGFVVKCKAKDLVMMVNIAYKKMKEMEGEKWAL